MPPRRPEASCVQQHSRHEGQSPSLRVASVARDEEVADGPCRFGASHHRWPRDETTQCTLQGIPQGPGGWLGWLGGGVGWIRCSCGVLLWPCPRRHESKPNPIRCTVNIFVDRVRPFVIYMIVYSVFTTCTARPSCCVAQMYWLRV